MNILLRPRPCVPPSLGNAQLASRLRQIASQRAALRHGYYHVLA